MTGKRQIAVAFLVAGLLLSSLISVITFKANANPIVIYMERSYGYLILDSNITLPEARVDFSIEPTLDGGAWVSYGIAMNATYTFVSPQTQLTSIALACPNTWTSNDSEIEILDNDSLLPYVILQYDDLISENESQTVDWNFLEFITFNCSLEAGISTDIIVLMDLGNRRAENGFTFQYFVGTARAWNGTTHEVIVMNMKNPSLLQSCSFSPSDSLTVEDNPLGRTATWDLNMDEFDEDSVQFTTTHNRPVWPEIDPTDLLIGGLTASFVIVIVVMVGVLVKRK